MSAWLLAALGILIASLFCFWWLRTQKQREGPAQNASSGVPLFELPPARRRGTSAEAQRSRFLNATEQRFCAVLRDLRTALVLAHAETQPHGGHEAGIVIVSGAADASGIGMVAANLALSLGALGSVLLVETSADDGARAAVDALPRRWPQGMIDVVARTPAPGNAASDWLRELLQLRPPYEWLVIENGEPGDAFNGLEHRSHDRSVFRILVDDDASAAAASRPVAAGDVGAFAVVRLRS